MAIQSQSEIIRDHSIGKGLDSFRETFRVLCKKKGISSSAEAVKKLDQDDIRKLDLILLKAVAALPAAERLPSKGNNDNLTYDLFEFIVRFQKNLDHKRVRPLLDAALDPRVDDAFLWDQVYSVLTIPSTPPQTTASSVQQTPWRRNTNSFANTSEHRKYLDDVLKEELGTIYVGLRDFDKTFLGDVVDLETASQDFFSQCQEGSDPFFDDGWTGWPENSKEDAVLEWLKDFSERLSTFTRGDGAAPRYRRRLLAQPNTPIRGSIATRKMDVGFVDTSKATLTSKWHWSQVLVPGELKSNPSADTATTWLDLARYAREVFAAQDNRRFVLGFTICGSLMRLWEFDRLGAIASEQFDINKDGLRFVSTMLGFYWMSEEQLGFDPTIITSAGTRYIEIQSNDWTEHLVLDKCIMRARCIAGRGTTCWKAHSKDDTQTTLVVKDSWQYVEREEEGVLLREAAKRGVVNVARYYHHETVQVGGMNDNIVNNVRKDLDLSTAKRYPTEHLRASQKTSTASSPLRSGSTAGQTRSSSQAGNPQPSSKRSSNQGESPLPPHKGSSLISLTDTDTTPQTGHSTVGQKRSSSQAGNPLPPSKRSRPPSSTNAVKKPVHNRVHRRVVLRDFGEPIYKAKSQAVLLRALAGCIKGHQSLHQAGFLHKDISIGNLMINEASDRLSWPSFLIDLDLAIQNPREGDPGLQAKTGTRAFMAIGALFGETHCFMHDLESFFWVLFWICIHFESSGPAARGRVVPEYDRWNYAHDGNLARIKLGTVLDDASFLRTATENFTQYFEPLIPWVDKLRRVVFPGNQRWTKKDENLYSSMTDVLLKAAEALSDA